MTREPERKPSPCEPGAPVKNRKLSPDEFMREMRELLGDFSIDQAEFLRMRNCCGDCDDGSDCDREAARGIGATPERDTGAPEAE
ncbi:MAG: hypothetical protein Q8R92_21010 [Deltaproteobacteria bacterium]|nr:hypothetical protein [Deltaproteobacteria bacterium]